MQTTNPQHVCRSIRTDIISATWWPRENVVAQRLLARGIELKAAYKELYDKLHKHPPALEVFFSLLPGAAAF